MSKALPVYDLSQWIKSDRNIGYVVARMRPSGDYAVWEVREDYKGRKDVERFNGRGAGYVIQWVDLRVDVGDGPCIDVPHPDEIGVGDCLNRIAGSVPRRLSWLRDETIAEKRYQPCENPVKAPAKYETFDPPSDDANDGVTAIAFDADGKGHAILEPSVAMTQDELEQAICAEDSQPALPLDIEARWCGGAEQVVEAMATVENAAVDIMRAVVAAGKKAEDWLIAKGLTL